MSNKIMPTGYGIVQTKIMQLKELSIQAKAIYALLASYTGAKDFCFPSIKKIGEDMNLSKPMVIKYLKELEKNQLIIKSKLNKNPMNHSNKYQILYIEDDHEGKIDLTLEDSIDLTLEDNSILPTMNNIILNNNKDNKGSVFDKTDTIKEKSSSMTTEQLQYRNNLTNVFSTTYKNIYGEDLKWTKAMRKAVHEFATDDKYDKKLIEKKLKLLKYECKNGTRKQWFNFNPHFMKLKWSWLVEEPSQYD